jgi:hypothetical protein
VAEVERIIRRRRASGPAALAGVVTTTKRNNDKVSRDNRKIRKIGGGGTCTHHGTFVAHKLSECRYKPNVPAVVSVTATAHSVDEIRAAFAADTSAAIQEVFKPSRRLSRSSLPHRLLRVETPIPTTLYHRVSSSTPARRPPCSLQLRRLTNPRLRPYEFPVQTGRWYTRPIAASLLYPRSRVLHCS